MINNDYEFEPTDDHLIGPLGSECWRMRLPRDCLFHLNDRLTGWNILGRRMLIDVEAGLVTWLNRSSTNASANIGIDSIVAAAEPWHKQKVQSLRGTRWRRPEEIRRTGIEADNSYYLGGNAESHLAYIRSDRWPPEDEWEYMAPPDLVVDVEITLIDHDRPKRYARLGAQEAWQIHWEVTPDGRASEPRIVILDVQAEAGPVEIGQSQVLPGLTGPNVAALIYPSFYQDPEILRKKLKEELGQPSSAGDRPEHEFR